MRIVTTSAALLLLLLSFVACKASDEHKTEPLVVTGESQRPAQEPAAAPKAVALVIKTLTNPFFITVEKGARRAEKELGIRLLVRTHGDETAIEQQIAIVKQLIQDKVDAIVIIPGHSTEMIPVVKQAQDAGIVIINIDNRLDPAVSREWGLSNVPFISVNNEQGAFLSAQYLGSKLTQPAEVAIIEGDPAAQASKDRKQGAKRAFAENPNTRLVAEETGHWKIDEAHQVAARLFERHPKLGAIFCANDMMALGVIRYLEETKKTGVLVAAYDNIEEAHVAIREGKLLVTVDQQAEEQGYQGIQYAVRALAGEKLPPETLIEVKLVTAESLQQEGR